MANLIQFEGKSAGCLECEANLTDALDGTLSAADQASFEAHIATCATCSQMLDEATRGVAWLEMLKMPRPEPSAMLLEKILAQTSGAGLPGRESDSEWTGYGMPVSNVPYGLPNYGISQPSLAQAFMPEVVMPGKVLPFRSRVVASSGWKSLRHNLLQPRLAMTAAMAFFSVALTLNMTGVKLNELHASDLGPSGIRRTFYDTSAAAARYYGNLKVVYVMESKLEDFRKNRDDYQPGMDMGTTSDKPVETNSKGQDRKAPGPPTSQRTPQALETKPRLMPVSDDLGATKKNTDGNSGNSTGEPASTPTAKTEYNAEGAGQ